ncbi:hypothetical protein Droror1_Dr00008037 [Drosera rotundifolia]
MAKICIYDSGLSVGTFADIKGGHRKAKQLKTVSFLSPEKTGGVVFFSISTSCIRRRRSNLRSLTHKHGFSLSVSIYVFDSIDLLSNWGYFVVFCFSFNQGRFCFLVRVSGDSLITGWDMN